MKWFRYYVYDMKLKYKLVLSYLLIIIVPMIASFLFFRYRFIDRLRDNTLSMEQTIMEQTAGSIEFYMNQIEEVAEIAAQSEILQGILASSEEDMNAAMRSQKRTDSITTYLQNISSRINGNVIQNIRIYCESDLPLFQYQTITKYGVFESMEKIETSLWYGLFQRENSPEQIVAAPFSMNSWEIQEVGKISLVKKVQYYVNGEKKHAFIAVYFNHDYLSNILNGYGNYAHSCIYLVDERESIVSIVYEDEMMQYILYYKDIDSVLGEEKNFVLLDYGDMAAWTIFDNIGYTKWKLVLLISEDAITGAAEKDSGIFMGAYMGITLILCLIVILLSNTMTKRITVLKNHMKNAKENPPKPLMIQEQGDEIGELIGSYNHMAKEINELLCEKVKNAREISRIELKSLRAQINPHFLYNTLDMISWYMKRGESQEATNAIQALAKFYKLSLNNGKLMTTVENEVTLLEKYIEIQSKRVRSPIDLFVDIPEEMLDREIPQFILQPIVENSLKHGILEKEDSSGCITVSGWLEEKKMGIIIADDGVGMEQEEIDKLFYLHSDVEKKENGNHMGIHNIYMRLLLLYGEDGFSMQYSSRKGEGTQVELHLAYELRGEAFSDVKL